MEHDCPFQGQVMAPNPSRTVLWGKSDLELFKAGTMLATSLLFHLSPLSLREDLEFTDADMWSDVGSSEIHSALAFCVHLK